MTCMMQTITFVVTALDIQSSQIEYVVATPSTQFTKDYNPFFLIKL